MQSDRSLRYFSNLLMAALLAACNEGDPAPPSPGEPEAGVIALRPQSIAVTSEPPGRTQALNSTRAALVKAQASAEVDLAPGGGRAHAHLEV